MARRVYLDACCFIEVAKAKIGAATNPYGQFVWPVQTLLSAAKNGDILAFTSTITLAECLHADGACDEEVQRLFRAMLGSGRSGVTPVSADWFVSERARDLRWKHKIMLNPLDSLHAATALELKCDEMLTFDGVTGKRKSLLKAAPEIGKLGLSVLLPDKTLSIPDKYRQHKLAIPSHGKPEEASPG